MKGQTSLLPLVAEHPLILLWEIIIPQFSFRESCPLPPTPSNSQTPSYRYYPVLPESTVAICCNMGHRGLSPYESYISVHHGVEFAGGTGPKLWPPARWTRSFQLSDQKKRLSLFHVSAEREGRRGKSGGSHLATWRRWHSENRASPGKAEQKLGNREKLALPADPGWSLGKMCAWKQPNSTLFSHLCPEVPFWLKSVWTSFLLLVLKGNIWHTVVKFWMYIYTVGSSYI